MNLRTSPDKLADLVQYLAEEREDDDLSPVVPIPFEQVAEAVELS